MHLSPSGRHTSASPPPQTATSRPRRVVCASEIEAGGAPCPCCLRLPIHSWRRRLQLGRISSSARARDRGRGRSHSHSCSDYAAFHFFHQQHTPVLMMWSSRVFLHAAPPAPNSKHPVSTFQGSFHMQFLPILACGGLRDRNTFVPSTSRCHINCLQTSSNEFKRT